MLKLAMVLLHACVEVRGGLRYDGCLTIRRQSCTQSPGRFEGLTTFLTHYMEMENANHAHITPIYQNSVFAFKDTDSGAAIAAGEGPGYYYTRLNNPNHDQLAGKLAVLEAWDLLKQNPDQEPEQLVGGSVFASGMAAVTSAILACVGMGDTILTQSALYDGTYLIPEELCATLWDQCGVGHGKYTRGLGGCFRCASGYKVGIYRNTGQPYFATDGYCRSDKAG